MVRGITFVGAVVAGFAAFLAFFPYAGEDTQPPIYYSVYGNRVPSGGPWVATAVGVAVGLVIGIVIGIAIWGVGRRSLRVATG